MKLLIHTVTVRNIQGLLGKANRIVEIGEVGSI